MKEKIGKRNWFAKRNNDYLACVQNKFLSFHTPWDFRLEYM